MRAGRALVTVTETQVVRRRTNRTGLTLRPSLFAEPCWTVPAEEHRGEKLAAWDPFGRAELFAGRAKRAWGHTASTAGALAGWMRPATPFSHPQNLGVPPDLQAH